jgi:amino acid transporter
MSRFTAPDVAAAVTAPAARLEPDAIGVVQDTVIGMASSAPAGTVAATLASLAAVSAYGGGLVLIVTAVPMLIIASAYRRLNLWNANCGASFEWVGRAISPYLGFLTGWLMIAGYLIGTVAEVVVLGPSVLAVFGARPSGPWAPLGIDTAVCLVMGVIAVIGIRLTARTQIVMAAVEYAILVGFSVAGLVAVLSHEPGTFHVSAGWWHLTGIGGAGRLPGGLLAAIYAYSLWDGTIYVNEEVKHRRVNPGRAALWAVGLLAVLYTLAQVGLQGVVSPAQLQGHAATALVYAAQALGGTGWAKAMALAIALSVTATTGTGIVLTSRIVYGMASWRVLPPFLGNVSRRFSTPVPASVAVWALIIAVIWVYLLATGITNVLSEVVAVAGLLAALFYVLTAAAMMVFYRRRVLATVRDSFAVGVLPLAASGFLGWVVFRSLQQAAAAEKWTITAIIATGLAMMLTARFGLKSPFFAITRETSTGKNPGPVTP